MVVRDDVAYVAHMKAPHGTSIVDVSDPAHPRLLAEVQVPAGTHSHKVQVASGLMLVNREAHPPGAAGAAVDGGLRIYDVSRPSAPREIGAYPFILDIEDMSKPCFVSGLDWSPPFPWPTHTTLPIPVDRQRGLHILERR